MSSGAELPVVVIGGVDGIDSAFVQDATRAARHLAGSGVAAMAAIEPGDLSAVGEGFAEALRKAVGG